jgi:hypothetical protein
MTWSYAQDIDGATQQDDGKLTLTTGFGTVGVFISEGADSSDTLKYILLFFQDSE